MIEPNKSARPKGQTQPLAHRRSVQWALLGAVFLAVLSYYFVPLAFQHLATAECGETLGRDGNGIYSARFVPFPVAHWECTSKLGRNDPVTHDLGWYPSYP